MSKYFGYKNDIDNLSSGSVLSKAGALGSMALKTVANIGIFAITEIAPEIARSTLSKYDKNLSDDQREKLNQVINNGESLEKRVTKYTSKE